MPYFNRSQDQDRGKPWLNYTTIVNNLEFVNKVLNYTVFVRIILCIRKRPIIQVDLNNKGICCFI